MKIHSFSISTKKGEQQATRWLVVHYIPFPDITTDCGGLKWRNGENLFPAYGRPGGQLAETYDCHLLTPNAEPPENYSRTDFAGYEGRPGTIKFRGRDLGEMTITTDGKSTYPAIRLDCTHAPSNAEADMIRALIVPKLNAFIADNREELRAAAIARLKQRCQEKLSEAKQALVTLEEEAARMIDKAGEAP